MKLHKQINNTNIDIIPSLTTVNSISKKNSMKKQRTHLKNPKRNKSNFTTSPNHQSNILSLLNAKDIRKTKKLWIPFDDYIDAINTSMSNYLVTSSKTNDKAKPEENKDNLISDHYLTAEDKHSIRKVYDNNRSFVSRGLNSLNEESALKVNLKNVDYKNAYQSLGIIKKNQFIYDEVSKDYWIRQRQLFDDSIRSFEGYTMKYKVKMPKIRVLALAPKIDNDIPVVDMTKDKKKKDQPLPPIPEAGLKFFSYYRYPNRNFPEGREQFSIAWNGANIIMIGGMSSVMKTMSVWSLNVEDLEWEKIQYENATNCRFGHTGCVFQNKVYVFGGRTKNINSSSLTSFFEVFSWIDRTWSCPSVYSKITVPSRRNHIAEIVGTQMWIHGGMGENDVWNDCYVWSFNPLKWSQCSINNYTPGPAVYGHSSSVVVPRDILSSNRFNIYKYPDTGMSKNLNSKIKERGWYIFGGKLRDDLGLSNQLWILQLGKKPLEWVKPETKGEPPSPRYWHSMNYYEKGNFLIIHGGRNDEHSGESYSWSDTYWFEWENFDWMKVQLYSHIFDFKILGRCGHQGMVYGNKLIILGGMNSNNYWGSTLLVCNLDFYYIPKMKTTEEILIDKLKVDSDPSSRNKIQKWKSIINKNQWGIVKEMELPDIK